MMVGGPQATGGLGGEGGGLVAAHLGAHVVGGQEQGLVAAARAAAVAGADRVVNDAARTPVRGRWDPATRRPPDPDCSDAARCCRGVPPAGGNAR